MWWSETVTDCCYVNRQIFLTSFSTDIKLLKTSFHLLTDRLTPSVTDRLLIMYGILLRHRFLCCSSCVQWVIGFLIWLMWTSFCQGTKYYLFHQTNILKRFFEWLSLTRHFTALTPWAWRFFLNIDISQYSEATWSRCGGIFKYDYCKFTAESNSERILKIGKHLAKLWTRLWYLVFWLTVYMASVDEFWKSVNI